MRKILASLLIGSALAGFQSDVFAQSRNGASRTSSGSSRSESVQRSSSNSSSHKSPAVSSSSASRPSGQSSVRPSGQSSRPSGQSSRPSVGSSSSRPSGNAVNNPSAGTPASRPSYGNSGRPSGQPADRPSGSNMNKPSGQMGNKPAPSGNNKPNGNFKPGNQNKPIGVNRPGVRPSDRPQNGPSHSRPVNAPHRPGYAPNRPHKPARPVGVKPPMRPAIYVYPTYVSRPYPGHRPPRPRPGVIFRPYYGTVIAHNIASSMAWTAVRLAYYSSVVRTYNMISDNNAYIAEQNAIIAQNNALIAAQNQAIANSDMLAQSAYSKAQRLGLVQSYAAADMEYYYQNGVFYVLDADGQYRVIVPPAGALVDELPDDNEKIRIDGEAYYKVDDTIYEQVRLD